MSVLLQAKDLSLSINGMPILKSMSFDLAVGQTLGLVGESGSGKSMTALAIIRLLPPGAKVSGSLLFNGEDLLEKNEGQMCAVRGQQISMAFQEPLTALNPVQSIGAQVAEVFVRHQRLDSAAAFARAAEVLERVGLPNKDFPLGRYPFELSGGQRQRVVIAIAVALKPKLLIADEPTTALDVTTEAKILSLLKRLCVEDQISLLFVSHDLAAVVRLADRIAIVKEGEIVEAGDTVDVFDNMHHPYSLSLREASMIGSRLVDADGPGTAAAGSAGAANPRQTVLQVENLSRDYTLPRERFFKRPAVFRAVNSVTFSLHAGESVGIVGESGSGKSTLVRAVLGLEPLQSGSVTVGGSRFWPATQRDQLPLRKKIQAVFQDPYGSFNPRHTVERVIAEPLYLMDARIPGNEREERVSASLESVGLSVGDRKKYPHEFSGGQRQRIAIARALVVAPSIVILDEATSALDVSVRAQVLELLASLSRRLGISYLFVSHDLDVMRAVTDRILIMQSGQIVEQGATARVFEAPEHPYTQSLLAAKPSLREEIENRRRMERVRGD